MTDQTSAVAPVEISLHRKSRLLEIAFSDGSRFQYPSEYLRVFPTGALQPDTPLHGKQGVDIAHLEPVGTSALQIEFDDGHAGRYSWSTLHGLAVNYERNWQAYLDALQAHGLQRGPGRATGSDGRVSIRLLYFIQLAKLAGRDEEQTEIPDGVTNVATLLAWLRRRGRDWSDAFADDGVQVTVNKHFAEPYTLVENGDEVAIVPRTR